MDKQLIIDKFKKHEIVLHPAGIWKLTSEGKKPEVAFRVDGLEIENYPKDNMFKLRIDETPYMVIDIDGGDVGELYQNIPSLMNTLTTTTTREDKLHIYIQRPEEFPVTRIIAALPNIDILSNGIVFEGHCYDHNPLYDIENDNIVSLNANEITYLMGLVPVGTKSSTNSEATRRYNVGEKTLVEEYLNGTLKDERKLWKALTPIQEHKRGKTNYEAPELAYDTFNTIAFYLALNTCIKHEVVISFLEKLLVQQYELSLNSSETQQRLYKQIIPTLPINEIDDFNDNFDSHIAKAPVSRDGRFKLLATVDNGKLKYVNIDKYTYIPQAINGGVIREKSAVQYLYPLVQAEMWQAGVAESMVELTADPYLPQRSYDFDRHVFILSTLRPSEYIINIGSRDSVPDNVITRAIKGIFKTTKEATCTVDPEDFYYHWLSHILFSTRQIVTILSLSTDASVRGGTGKSTFASKLPMHILPLGTAFKIDEGTSGWGDAFADAKLTAFDDLSESKDWTKIYGSMKRETSEGPKKANMKGKGTKIQTKSSCLSVSSNFIPKIDETDRRFFIWSPTEKLDKTEGRLLSNIMGDFDNYHVEIQEIADYCNYIYSTQKDKYYNELYIEAPNTSFNNNAKIDGTSSGKLLSMIKHGPEALFDSFVPNKKNILSKTEIIKFILSQTSDINAKSNGMHTFHAPHNFIKLVLNATRDEDVSNESPKKIAFLVGATYVPLNNKYQEYREDKRFSDWATRGLRISLEPSTIKKYEMWLKYNSSDTEIVEQEVDISN